MQKIDELISKNKVTQRATNVTDKKKWVITMSFRQITHIKTDPLAKGFNFSFLQKHCLINMLWPLWKMQ